MGFLYCATMPLAGLAPAIHLASYFRHERLLINFVNVVLSAFDLGASFRSLFLSHQSPKPDRQSAGDGRLLRKSLGPFPRAEFFLLTAAQRENQIRILVSVPWNASVRSVGTLRQNQEARLPGGITASIVLAFNTAPIHAFLQRELFRGISMRILPIGTSRKFPCLNCSGVL